MKLLLITALTLLCTTVYGDQKIELAFRLEAKDSPPDACKDEGILEACLESALWYYSIESDNEDLEDLFKENDQTKCYLSVQEDFYASYEPDDVPLDDEVGKCEDADAWCLQYYSGKNTRKLASLEELEVIVKLKVKELEDTVDKVEILKEELKDAENELKLAEKEIKKEQEDAANLEKDVCKDIKDGINGFLKEREKSLKEERGDKDECFLAIKDAKLTIVTCNAKK